MRRVEGNLTIMMDNQRPAQWLGLQMGSGALHNFRSDLAAAMLFSVFNVVFNQFYIPMAIQQGASHIQVGLLTAAPAVGLAFSPLWASWIERSSPKPFVVVPSFIARMLILLPALFAKPWVFVGAALGFQLLQGIQAPAYASLMTRIYPAPLRGRLMGYVRVAMGVLMIPLAYFIGFWIDAAGPRWPLILAVGMGIASLFAFNRIKESEPVPEARPGAKRVPLRDQWQLVKQNKALTIFLAATTLSGFGNILANPIYQIIQVQKLGLTNVEIGYARMVYFACLLTAYLFVGWAIDRFKPERTIIYGIAAFSVVPMLYGFFGSYPAVLVGSGIQGIGDAIWDIGILTYVFRLAPGREAVVFGLHLMLFGIRGTIAPLLSTSLSDIVPLSVLLLTASGCGWLGTLLFFLGRKKHEADSSAAGVC